MTGVGLKYYVLILCLSCEIGLFAKHSVWLLMFSMVCAGFATVGILGKAKHEHH